MELQNHPNCRPFVEAGRLTQLDAWYEEGRNILWMMLKGDPRPSFNLTMLGEIAELRRAVLETGMRVDFWVTGSSVPNIYNVGGDLAYFASHIRDGDRDGMRKYAHACIDAIYHAMTGFEVGAVSIAMVEGSALGGGLECALAHNYVLAQKDAKMGFPEIAFNMFPGMGAYSFVSRMASMRLADKLIMSGETHTAEWFAREGLVNHVFDAGNAYRSVRTLVDEVRPKLQGCRAMIKAKQRVLGITRAELIDITNEWVDTAFEIGEHDLAHMERLVALQDKRLSKTATVLRAA
ncbi:MAG: crotonase/enoyl-CoA hydratase family protein [Burkholderiaceae bacterium]